MDREGKPYRGMAMEGPIATWYARNTGREIGSFRAVAERVAQATAPGARVLEVAPGPGYLALEVARRGRQVTGLDISQSFVRIARKNAAAAGVAVVFCQGNASAMPFPDRSFDFVVCRSAFKNFTDPAGALGEMYRVLAPGGRAWIQDLRKEATPEEIGAEVAGMGLSAANALLTRWIFRTLLLRNAYDRGSLERLVAGSAFGRGEIRPDGIGFELRLARPPEGGA